MQRFDLIIIGTGSGNTIPNPDFAEWDIAIVEDAKFGGTCTNVGCIPTKMFVHPADLAQGARAANSLGVTASVDGVDWPAMRDRIFGRIDKIEAAGRRYRTGERSPNTTVFEGHGRFTGVRELTIDLHGAGTQTITADRIVIAAGGRPVIPDLPGLADLPPGLVHTSDTIMRLPDLPARMVVIGGGYVAAEFCHVFDAFGVRIVQVQRGPRLLTHHDRDIADAFTADAAQRWDVRLGTTATGVRSGPGGTGVSVDLSDGTSVDADLVLLAVGRTPNGDRLDLPATGLAVDPDSDPAGLIAVDEFQRTAVDGIFALGDVSSHWQLKHVANHEARIVAHNLLHPDDLRAADHRYVPAAVFTQPQIASVGLTEQQATERGVPFVTGRRDYGGIAAGWAREEHTGFLKVLADPVTGMLIGAHVIGPEAATVIQPLIQAMSFGTPARRVAEGQYWIHPALSEVVENALLDLPAPTGG